MLKNLLTSRILKKTLLSSFILLLPLTNLIAAENIKTTVKKNLIVAQAADDQKLQQTSDVSATIEKTPGSTGGVSNETNTPSTTPVPQTDSTDGDDTIYNSYIIDSQRYDRHDPNADAPPQINDTNYSGPRNRPGF